MIAKRWLLILSILSFGASALFASIGVVDGDDEAIRAAAYFAVAAVAAGIAHAYFSSRQ